MTSIAQYKKQASKTASSISENMAHRQLSKRCKRKFHLDAHIPPDFNMLDKDFSPVKFVKRVLSTGADSVCLFSKCHYGYSYYSTKIGYPHPGLKIDLLGTLSREFKAQNPDIPVFVYYNLRFSPVDNKLHPEWLLTSPSKNADEYEKGHISPLWWHMCFNSQYGKVVLQQLEEITRNYPVDGFFIDFSRASGECHCEGCRAKYLAETGKDIPETSFEPEYPEYAAWQMRDSDHYLLKVTEELQKIRPHISVGSNYCYSHRHPVKVDKEIGYLTEDVLERDQAIGCYESMHGRYYMSLGVPAEIMTTRMSNWWLDWGFKSLDALLLQNSLIASLGINICLADELYPSYQIPDRTIKIFSDVFKRVELIQDIMNDAVSIPEVLVLHSAQTYYTKPRAVTDNSHYLEAVNGMHSILQHSNYHYQIVNEYVLAKWLKKAKVLILPCQSRVSNKTTEIIENFVKGGGVLIASGDTLLNKKLHKLLGIKSEGKFDTPHQFLFSKPFIDSGRENDPIVVNGKTVKVIPDGAKIVSMLQEGLFSPEKFFHGHPEGEVRFAGITEHYYGKGKAIAIAAPVGRSTFLSPNPELRKLILAIINNYNPDSFILAKNQDNVEITHFYKDGTHIVNLINHPIKMYCNDNYKIDRIAETVELKLEFHFEEKPESVYLEAPKAESQWNGKMVN